MVDSGLKASWVGDRDWDMDWDSGWDSGWDWDRGWDRAGTGTGSGTGAGAGAGTGDTAGLGGGRGVLSWRVDVGKFEQKLGRTGTQARVVPSPAPASSIAPEAPNVTVKHQNRPSGTHDSQSQSPLSRHRSKPRFGISMTNEVTCFDEEKKLTSLLFATNSLPEKFSSIKLSAFRYLIAWATKLNHIRRQQ